MIDVNNTLNDTSSNNKEHIKIEHNKKSKYANERKELTKKLFQLLKVDNDNKIFYSLTLDNDVVLQKLITDMISDIKKYFYTGQWSYFIDNKNKKKKPYISMTKNILKDMGIKIMSRPIKRKEGNIFRSCIVYTILNDLSDYF